MNKILLTLITLVTFSFSAWINIYGGRGNFTTDKDFHLLFGGYGTSIRGDFSATGNSILKSNHPNNANLITDTTTYKMIDSAFDNSIYDLNDHEKRNSSSAQLILPSYVKGTNIVWAGLFWQGHVYRSTGTYNDAQVDANAANWNRVTIKDPQGNMHQIEAPIGNNNLSHKAFHHTVRATGFNKGYRHHYGAYYDITNIVKNSYSFTNNTFTVGNIKTTAGNDNGGYVYIPAAPTYSGNFRFGLYGGWSIIVVYNVDNEIAITNDVPLKTVSIYDGFDLYLTWGNGTVPFETTIDISGFYTPISGEINSKLLLFAGAGDRGISDDTLQIQNKKNINSYIDLSNTPNPSGIQFNHTYTNLGEHMTPGDTNKQGMDLDIFDISNQMDNEQTSTKIKFGVVKSGSHCDQLFPQVIGFSTQLYEPRVCYYIDTIKQIDTNTTIFENKKFVGAVEADKEYEFDIWISNMKKNSSDTFIETAKLVQVYMNMYNVDYSENSMSMQNLGAVSKSPLSDATGDDKGEFASDQNKSTWRVGIDANESQGGTLAPASNFNDDSKKAFITYKGKFQVEQNATAIDLVNFFKFKASFQTDSITIGSDNAQFIEQCVDLNTSANVTQPPKGSFNVVNASFSGNSLNDDSDTALFTQVSGQSFSVKIVALNDDFQTLQSYTGDVNLSLISSPSYTGDESSDQALCDSATSVGSPITIQFNNETIKPISLVTNDAMKSASFKISFESNGVVKHVCSTDSFAIRPANYSYSFTPSTLIGGKEHTLTSNAGTSLYDGTASQTISLIIPPGCGLGADTNTTSITFSGGIDSSLVRTGNIGDYNITVVDNTWTGIDQGTSHGDDCIVGSFENTPSGGLVGCNTQTSQTFTFSPKDFLNTLALQNFNANNFTYISNDNNMSATATATITARLDNNTTASAYSANCYAKDINTTISLIDEPLASEWLTNDRNATVRIMFFDTNTTNSELNATGSSTLSSGQNNFNNGIANITINFNFDRNTSIPDEPFHISRNDFNISVIDTNGVTGIDFNRTNDTNTTFYYGRVYAPDQTFNGNNGNAQFHYEVYCEDCNRTSLNIAGNESINNINWYQNTLHANATLGSFIRTNPTTPPTPLSGTTIGASTLNTLGLTAPNLPHVDRITYTPHPWLIFNPSNPNATTGDFMVEFTSRGGWGGEGTVDGSDDNNTGLFIHRQDTINNQIQKRMDW